MDEDTSVSFDANASIDNVGVESYAWNFGDGNMSMGVAPSHTYTRPGTYTVTLTVTDDGGNVDTDALIVTVNDTTAPTADVGQNQTVYEDTQVNFNASASTDNGQIARYEWDFGDGGTATGVTPTHTYIRPGTYTVNLTVTDASGNNATDVLTVAVQADTSGNGGNGGGGGGRSVADDRFSFDLVSGAGSTDLDAAIVGIEIVFADDASGTVTVKPSDERPTDANPIPDATWLAFVDVTVPPSLTDAEVTLQLTLDATTLGDVDPVDLVVYHYDGSEWTTLETTVVSTSDGEIVIEAVTPGFSLFAVGAAPEQTPSDETTPGSDEEPTPSEVSTPGDETGASNPDTEATDDRTPDNTTPGAANDVGNESPTSVSSVALVAVLGAAILLLGLALIVVHRRSRS